VGLRSGLKCEGSHEDNAELVSAEAELAAAAIEGSLTFQCSDRG
jgi:hypothetical protein